MATFPVSDLLDGTRKLSVQPSGGNTKVEVETLVNGDTLAKDASSGAIAINPKGADHIWFLIHASQPNWRLRASVGPWNSGMRSESIWPRSDNVGRAYTNSVAPAMRLWIYGTEFVAGSPIETEIYPTTLSEALIFSNTAESGNVQIWNLNNDDSVITLKVMRVWRY